MKMIGNQSLGKTPRIGLPNNPAKPIQEIIPVRFIPKDLTTFNPLGDNVVQSTWCIYPRFARHDQPIAQKIIIAKLEN
jgi:hypothetical protein